LNILDDLHQDSKESRHLLNGLIEAAENIAPVINNIQAEQLKSQEQQEIKDLENSFKEQKRWLSSEIARREVPGRLYAANIKNRHKGTCTWVLEDDKFKAWRSGERSNLLWLRGSGGFGKSILVSFIIEELEKEIPEWDDPKPEIVYFFCKAGDETTKLGHSIMRHLLVQLLDKANLEGKDIQTKAREKPKMDEFVNIVKRAKGNLSKISEQMSVLHVDLVTVLQPMFAELANALKTKVYLILDALDECGVHSTGLLDALKALAGSDLPISILITSRPSDDISRVLNQWPSIEIDKSKTDSDISKYTIESLKSEHRFGPDECEKAGRIVAKKADGMFRCKSPLPGASSHD
jgi:hypothetical protein